MKKHFLNTLLVALTAATLFAIPASSNCCEPGSKDCQAGQKQCQGVCPDCKCAECQCQKDKCQPAKAHKKHKHGKHMGKKMPKRADAFAAVVRDLDLTPEQGQKVRPIVSKYQEQCKAARAAHDAKMEAILGHKVGKPAGKPAKLTDDQKAELKKLVAEDRANRKAAMDSFQKELAPILDENQKAKLAQNIANFPKSPKSHRGHKGPKGPHHGMHGHGPHGGPEMMVKDFNAELNLSEAQQKQLAEIMAKHNKAWKAREEEAKKQFEADRQSLRKDIESILNPEQKAKFQEMVKDAPPCMGKGPGPRGSKHMRHHKNAPCPKRPCPAGKDKACPNGSDKPCSDCVQSK